MKFKTHFSPPPQRNWKWVYLEATSERDGRYPLGGGGLWIQLPKSPKRERKPETDSHGAQCNLPPGKLENSGFVLF